VVGDLVLGGQLGGVSVSKEDVAALLPHHHSKRELDADARIALHQLRAGARVAEHHHLLSRQLQSDVASRRGVIDAGEHRQASFLDRVDQARRRLRVTESASRDDHDKWIVHDALEVEVGALGNRHPPAQVPVAMIDFGPLRRREKSLQDLAAGLTRDDLARLTKDMCAAQLAAIEDATDEDVVMVPDDPEANDTFAARPEDVGLSWTLGHVVVHTTASSEESAALALVLARGLPVPGRSRYEVPWEQARTAAFIRHRIEESLSMRLAMLAAWPDQPHLENFYSPYEGRPPMNAMGRFLGGLAHDESHLGQMRKIMDQARRGRAAA
jgi:hypothetical protein